MLYQFPVKQISKFVRSRNSLLALACSLACATALAQENTAPSYSEYQWAMDNSGEPVCKSVPDISEQAETYCPEDEDDKDNVAPAENDVDINWSEAVGRIDNSGEEIVIAMIDTGIDYLHPELAARIWQNPGEVCGNGIDDDGNGYVDDCHGINAMVPRYLDESQTVLNPAAGDPMDNWYGHGTRMAGIMAAANDSAGIDSINGDFENIKIATCAAARMVNDAITYPAYVPFAKEQDTVQCMEYFTDLASRENNPVNIVVINASGGASYLNNAGIFIYPVTNEPYRIDTPAFQEKLNLLEEMDIAVVSASGNFNWDIDGIAGRAYYPAAFDNDNIIAVSAVDPAGELGGNSSWGRWSIDLAAPGETVISTAIREPVFRQSYADELGSLEDVIGTMSFDYAVAMGSSDSTAFVSATVALLKAHVPTSMLSLAEIKRLFLTTGKPLPVLADKTVSGRMLRLYGDEENAGILNCDNNEFKRRDYPQWDKKTLMPGTQLELRVQNIRCHQSAGTLSIDVHDSDGAVAATLYDDGHGADAIADDGIYSGTYEVPTGFEPITLNLGQDSVTETDDVITINRSIVWDNRDKHRRRSWWWWPSINSSAKYGSNYYYGSNGSKKSFTWLPEIPETGRYRLYGWWPPKSAAATNALWHIQESEGERIVPVNMRQGGGQWQYLGEFTLEAGVVPVEMRNYDSQGKLADGGLYADAIKLEIVE